ncbi:MAG: hypothetical protein ABL998_08390 [Planctomycetota bacterium]
MNAADVRYFLVGGYAVAFHARPRYTKYLNLWIEPTLANAERAWRALAAFGAPLQGLRLEDLTRPEMVFQIGLAPNRIDLLTELQGVDFGAAWERRATTTYGDCSIPVLSRADLIQNKRAVGRPQDLIDVAELERGS